MSGEGTITAVDGRDALFGLFFRPGPDNTVTVEMFGSGMGREEAVLQLRRTADALESQIRPPS